MKKKLFILTSLLLIICFTSQLIPNYSKAAERIYWYKRMAGGNSILYWIHPDVSYSPAIRNAEIEIEYPAAGYKNPMKLTQTSTKSSAKIEFHQINVPNTYSIAITYSYRSKNSAMNASDKDIYDWYWCKIDLNKALMKNYTPARRKTFIVHEMLHAYGGRDTYSLDQLSSIMFGNDYGTATGVTKDANDFLKAKYSS